MSYTVTSHDSTVLRGNWVLASGTWAAGGTHTKPETIVTGLGELKMVNVYVDTHGNQNGTYVDLTYAMNETKNGTAQTGSIGIKTTNGSTDAGEWWAIGNITSGN